ncbi:class I SAM-dependent methyltransferase [Synechococcus sp. PCC 6312]|uniref:class I SAM-dependent methyltransferase n=1 Tax=Synechococcus sp. (strain ATCC 27167 / PCC 6312) TaxID=195253 RepID=UPI00029F312F|nr:class I SAM-dependent methyltransferase [Synechococcus sp. PCC 6312]AFY60505.1 methylase involved in ubiquinone/menaquinone biosynthesis [Synechococcus sp. PCC 6312]
MNTSNATDATTRFSNRVSYYVKYRPSYPAEIVEFLSQRLSLSPTSVIADIGSGTGILSELFLNNGNQVYGVEPNLEMRQAAELLLENHPNFISINGSAEITTLENHSVDFIVAGQAFHWFDGIKSRQEFQRILKPGAWVVLIWNDRQTESTPFLRAFEAFLQEFSTDYQQINHKNVDDRILSHFYGSSHYQQYTFPNQQIFDYEGLLGRVLSSSYIPMSGDLNYDSMLAALEQLFARYQEQNQVSFIYDTRLFYGQLR